MSILLYVQMYFSKYHLTTGIKSFSVTIWYIILARAYVLNRFEE